MLLEVSLHLRGSGASAPGAHVHGQGRRGKRALRHGGDARRDLFDGQQLRRGGELLQPRDLRVALLRDTGVISTTHSGV